MPKYKAASQTKKDTACDKKKRRALIKDGHSKMITHGVPVLAAVFILLLGFLKYITSNSK